MALLQLQRIPVRVTLANNNLDWEEEKTNIKNYLNQEFDNVRYLKAAERLDGILPTGIFDFTEPLEGFDDNEFLDNFRNTFGNKVIVSTDRTELEEQVEDE